MALKDWDDVPYTADDCVRDHNEWNNMVEYILHSACTDFIIYGTCPNTDEVFKFGGNNDIDFDGDRAIMIDVDETYIGHGAGDTVTTGEYNTLVGYNAGNKIALGDKNTLIGYKCGEDISENLENTGCGYYALLNTTGVYNTAIGSNALIVNTVGTRNTALGRSAGQDASNSLTNCVYLGFEAGKDNAASHRLYINGSDSAYPLIYGEFNNDIVKIGNNSDDFGLIFDVNTAGVGKIYGGDDTGDDLKLFANTTNNCSMIELLGNTGIVCKVKAASTFEISTCSDETLFEVDNDHVDFHCFDAHNFVLELRTTNPSSPTCTGQIWFRTDLV